tara:strand:+ start:3158 stop:3406 length:249 start_codon:yes stop_codon:yes gene_type:complete
MMSKKHFELIAKVLSNQKKIDIQLVNELMDIFEMINPNFNRNIFLKKVVNNKKIYISQEDKLLMDNNIKWTNPSIITKNESN